MTRPITNNPLFETFAAPLLLLGTLCQRGKKIEAFAILICPCTFCINVCQIRPGLADSEKVQANQNIVAFYMKKRPKQSKQVRVVVVVVVSRQHGVIFCASLSRRGRGGTPRCHISDVASRHWPRVYGGRIPAGPRRYPPTADVSCRRPHGAGETSRRRTRRSAQSGGVVGPDRICAA
jgi:hypothetical protein